jgi:hypothetical protein
MKYLKLWEAFKSEILSKTMAFLSESGKKKFMNELKDITNYISYPLSELSDEYFQKLNFDKALKLNFNEEDSVCDATSDRSYPDQGVPGAICDKGMVDRKWGRGVRKAQCTVCGGTGIKPVLNANPKWIKFWFDKNGNYITKSAVDGVIRLMRAGVVKDKATNVVYNKVSEISFASQFINFPTGTKFWININREDTIATLFKEDGKCYMIQDVSSGSVPNGTEWQRFGSLSWIIRTDSDFRGKAYLLKEKTDDDSLEKEPNPYTWNAKLDLNRRTMSCTDYPSLEEELKSASFAIVLNVLDLYKSEYKTLASTKKEREESKSGSLALMTDEQIRYANAQKYLKEISKRIQISSDLTNLKRGVTKIIGSNFVGFYIFNPTMTNNLSNLEMYIYYIMKSYEVDYYVDKSNNLIKSEMEIKIEQNRKISRNLESMFSTLSTSEETNDKKLSEIILKLKTFMQLAHEIVSVKTINSIRDIEILRQKFNSVRSVMNNSRRFIEIWSILQDICHVDIGTSRTLRWMRGNVDVFNTDFPILYTAKIDMALEQMDEFIETSKELLK